jgi:hypothetical protein
LKIRRFGHVINKDGVFGTHSRECRQGPFRFLEARLDEPCTYSFAQSLLQRLEIGDDVLTIVVAGHADDHLGTVNVGTGILNELVERLLIPDDGSRLEGGRAVEASFLGVRFNLVAGCFEYSYSSADYRVEFGICEIGPLLDCGLVILRAVPEVRSVVGLAHITVMDGANYLALRPPVAGGTDYFRRRACPNSGACVLI